MFGEFLSGVLIVLVILLTLRIFFWIIDALMDP